MSFHRGSSGKDFGGDSYGKKPRRIKPGSSLSFRCRDCSKVRYVSNLELNRASRPRCLGCGGPLMETDATAEKTMSDESAQNAKMLNESDPDPRGNCRCWGCDLAYRKNYYLGKHLEESESCREQYRIKEKIAIVSGRFYAGTFTMLKQDDKKVHIVALSADINAWCDVAIFDAIYKAEEFIKPFSISLQATRIKQHWQEKPKRESFSSDVRCPVCRSRFVSTSGGSAEAHLENHLVNNNYCFANIDQGELKTSAAARRGKSK